MKRIFRNMIPYWKTIILIVLMLMVQVWCDLAMPQYTLNIIDVGIINSGVEHVIPEQITTEEFEMAKLYNSQFEEVMASSFSSGSRKQARLIESSP